MTMTSLGSPIVIGPVLPAPFLLTAGTDTATIADAAGEGAAMVFIALDSVTIDVMSFRITAFTTSVVMTCSIEALDASGNPDGTPIGSSVNSASITATGVYEVTGLGAAVTAGTVYAACVRYSSGTSGSILLRQDSTSGSSIPHMMNKTGASWGQQTAGAYGCTIGIGTSTTAYLHWNNTNGPHTITDQAYTDADAIDEYGLRFQVTAKMRVTGILAAAGAATGSSLAVTLTDASGNDVGSTFKSYDSDIFGSATLEGMAFLPFAAAFTVVANTTYVAGIKSTGAGNISLRKVTMNTNGQLGAWWSKEWFQATRAGATSGNGAWTLTADTICPLIWLVVDQIDDGAGGGGLLTGPGMSGGMRG